MAEQWEDGKTEKRKDGKGTERKNSVGTRGINVKAGGEITIAAGGRTRSLAVGGSRNRPPFSKNRKGTEKPEDTEPHAASSTRRHNRAVGAFLFYFEQKDAKITKAGLRVVCGVSFAVFATFCSNS